MVRRCLGWLDIEYSGTINSARLMGAGDGRSHPIEFEHRTTIYYYRVAERLGKKPWGDQSILMLYDGAKIKHQTIIGLGIMEQMDTLHKTGIKESAALGLYGLFIRGNGARGLEL